MITFVNSIISKSTSPANYSSISLFQTARDGQYMVEGVASHASHQESHINSVTRDFDLMEAISVLTTSRSVSLSFSQRDLARVYTALWLAFVPCYSCVSRKQNNIGFVVGFII